MQENHKTPEKNDSEYQTLQGLLIERGQTQKDVNYKVLKYIVDNFNKKTLLKALDLPCGTLLFLNYLRKIFPDADLLGGDISKLEPSNNIRFIEMDLTQDFPEDTNDKFDLITSISGVMMFGNTLRFISNCSKRLKDGGTFIVTNDNSATIIDKLSFLFLGRYRIFKTIFEDREELIQNVSIQELCRLLRTNGLTIKQIKFTSFYRKDLIYLPIAILVYPVQWLYLKRQKTQLPKGIIREMFPFRHLFCKHYIIITQKD